MNKDYTYNSSYVVEHELVKSYRNTIEILLVKLDFLNQVVQVFPVNFSRKINNVKSIINIAIQNDCNRVIIVANIDIDHLTFNKYLESFIFLEIELKDYIFRDINSYFSYYDNKKL